MASSFPTSVEAAIEYKDKVYRDDENTPNNAQPAMPTRRACDGYLASQAANFV